MGPSVCDPPVASPVSRWWARRGNAGSQTPVAAADHGDGVLGIAHRHDQLSDWLAVQLDLYGWTTAVQGDEVPAAGEVPGAQRDDPADAGSGQRTPRIAHQGSGSAPRRAPLAAGRGRYREAPSFSSQDNPTTRSGPSTISRT